VCVSVSDCFESCTQPGFDAPHGCIRDSPLPFWLLLNICLFSNMHLNSICYVTPDYITLYFWLFAHVWLCSIWYVSWSDLVILEQERETQVARAPLYVREYNTHTCMYMYTNFIYIYIYIYIYVVMRLRACVYVFMYVYTCYIYIYTHTLICRSSILPRALLAAILSNPLKLWPFTEDATDKVCILVWVYVILKHVCACTWCMLVCIHADLHAVCNVRLWKLL
jgi:hypothetical protein